MSPLISVVAVILLNSPQIADTTEHQVIAVREGQTISIFDNEFEFKLRKIRGYSVEIRAFGSNSSLKIDQSVSPPGSTCRITLKEIAPETRIARFWTQCPKNENI